VAARLLQTPTSSPSHCTTIPTLSLHREFHSLETHGYHTTYCSVIHLLDANHDITTLRSLSTTCQTLCAPCQRRLFSSITIGRNANVCEYLLEGLLFASHHLASYIRYLDYKCRKHDLRCLETILNQLSVANLNIEVLKISSRGGVIGLNRALSSLFRSPSIRRLQLHGITNPPWFTTDAPNLTDLVLDVDSEVGGVQPVTLGLKSLNRGLELRLDLKPTQIGPQMLTAATESSMLR